MLKVGFLACLEAVTTLTTSASLPQVLVNLLPSLIKNYSLPGKCWSLLGLFLSPLFPCVFAWYETALAPGALLFLIVKVSGKYLHPHVI